MSEILTIQSDRGRTAFEEIAALTYKPDLAGIPPEWVRVLLDHGVPASFVVIDPDRRIEYPNGDVRYAFLKDAATRPDRRNLGLFRRLLEETGEELRRAGIPWVIGRVPYALGRRLGFSVFTNYSCFILHPEEIEQTLGPRRPEGAEDIIAVDESPDIREDTLVVTDVRAETESDAVVALREAAWVARSRGKIRILFEYPPASAPGSRYPIHAGRRSPLLVVAMVCTARVRLSGSERDEDDTAAEEERKETENTDMVKLLDLPAVLEQVLAAIAPPPDRCPEGAVAFDTDAGSATIRSGPQGWSVEEGTAPDATLVPLPADAIAQVITGYRAVRTQAYLYQAEIPPRAADLLEALFPRFWRFSRNERWVYGQQT